MENKVNLPHLIDEAQKFLELGEQIQSDALSLDESERKGKLDELTFKGPLERQCDLLSILEENSVSPNEVVQKSADIVIEEGDTWHQAFEQILEDINASSIEPKLTVNHITSLAILSQRILHWIA